MLSVNDTGSGGQPSLESYFGESIAATLLGKINETKDRKESLSKIQARVQQTVLNDGYEEIKKMIACLEENCFQPNKPVPYRKGGLAAIGAVAVGLSSEHISYFLQDIMHLVIGTDTEQGPFTNDCGEYRIRYLACESLFNIAKVANHELLPYIPTIFDGISRLFADVNTEVRHAAMVLDKLLRDIVTSAAAHGKDQLSKFPAETFVQQLGQRMKFKNPNIRQLCLGWTTMILGINGMDAVRYTPIFINEVFDMLADADDRRDSRHNADNLLDLLLTQVKESPPEQAMQIVFDTLGVLASNCQKEDKCIRLCALCWLYEYVYLTPGFTPPGKEEDMDEDTKRMRNLLLGWRKMWGEELPQLLPGIFKCITDKENEVSLMAVDLNNSLLDLAHRLGESLPVQALVAKLSELLVAQGKRPEGEGPMVVHIACLQWICLLLSDSPAAMLRKETLKELFMPIFESLLHPNDEVVITALRVLAQIMEAKPVEEELCIEDLLPEEECTTAGSASASSSTGSEKRSDLFTVIVHRLLREFSTHQEMLESRGRLMIRQVCGYLDPQRLYVTVARAIQQEKDRAFAQKLVQTFSWILLTAVETRGLREELLRESEQHPQLLRLAGQPTSEEARADLPRPLFLELLEPWFHNPTSALALCLWAQQYELASELTGRFASFEPTLDFLQQLDQLVRLLESPIFSRLRLQLLEPRRHPALLKCLLGLAMLLPQAGAFQILRERMHLVQSSLLMEVRSDGEAVPAPSKSGGWWSGGSANLPDAQADFASLVAAFDRLSKTE